MTRESDKETETGWLMAGFYFFIALNKSGNAFYRNGWAGGLPEASDWMR